MSTASRADQIVVLDRGPIVEWGSHADLVARPGHYAAFVRPGEAAVAPADAGSSMS